MPQQKVVDRDMGEALHSRRVLLYILSSRPDQVVFITADII